MLLLRFVLLLSVVGCFLISRLNGSKLYEIEEDLDGQVFQETYIGGWDVRLQPGFTFALTYSIQLPSDIIFDDNAPIAISEVTFKILHKIPAPYWINTQVDSKSLRGQAKDSAVQTTTFFTTVVTSLNPKDSKHDQKLSEDLVSSIVSTFRNGRFKDELLALGDEKKSNVFKQAALLNVAVKVLEDTAGDLRTSALAPFFMSSSLTTMVLLVSLVLCLVYMYCSYGSRGQQSTPPASPYKRKSASTSYVV